MGWRAGGSTDGLRRGHQPAAGEDEADVTSKVDEASRDAAEVRAFLASLHNESKAEDSRKLLAWMAEASGNAPKMWPENIVGFGSYEKTEPGGEKANWMRIGFSPRKRELVVYVISDFAGFADLRAKLGRCKPAKGCLYIKRLSDVDEDILKQLFTASLATHETVD